MAKTTKLTHPEDAKASVEATDDYVDMYRSQGWTEPTEKK